MYPYISVMIATYNSAWTIEKPLQALRNQDYPQDRMDIMVIDGGSRDDTTTIAKKYGCRIIDNPKVDPVSAKYIGLHSAKGKYLLSLDHDEVLVNPESIKMRIEALEIKNECKVALCSGYRCPDGYRGLNSYVTEFGDPFSCFYYRSSIGYEYFQKTLEKWATLEESNEGYEIYRFDKRTDIVLLELLSAAIIINLEYFKGIIDFDNCKDEIEHFFYKMIENGQKDVIYTINDPLDHYSVDSIKSYLPKLKWRVVNNIHFENAARQGFEGRSRITKSSKIKKYLFIPYSLSLVVPFLDACYLAISRKNKAYFLHVYLCMYVAAYILYQYTRKILHIPPKIKAYNGDSLE